MKKLDKYKKIYNENLFRIEKAMEHFDAVGYERIKQHHKDIF